MASVTEFQGTRVLDGVTYTEYCNEEDLTYIRDELQLLADDIVVATYPKAGTTWMQEIIWSLINGPEAVNGREQALDVVFPFIEEHVEEPGLEKIKRLPKPRLIKTHLQAKFLKRSLEGETGCPRIIVVIRNPKDVYVSFQHFLNSLGGFNKLQWNNFFELIKAKKVPFGDAFNHVRGWWKYRDHPNVHIVKYEDMKLNPKSSIQNVADFLKIPIDADTLNAIVEQTSFASMKARPPDKYFSLHQKSFDYTEFFHKGEVGGSNDILTEDQKKYMDERIASELNAVGINWD